MALPPVQPNPDDAKSTVTLPATMGRLQREHSTSRHADKGAAPLYHLERESDQANELHTMAT